MQPHILLISSKRRQMCKTANPVTVFLLNEFLLLLHSYSEGLSGKRVAWIYEAQRSRAKSSFLLVLHCKVFFVANGK